MNTRSVHPQKIRVGDSLLLKKQVYVVNLIEEETIHCFLQPGNETERDTLPRQDELVFINRRNPFQVLNE